MLPKNTALGELQIFEIYEFYNIPVLFACKNKAGHVYLGVWVDETDEENAWLYAALSEKRLHELRYAKIDLHDAFALSEDEAVLEVIVYKNSNRQAEIRSIPNSEVDQSWFPIPGDFLDYPNSLPRVMWEGVDQRHIIEVYKYELPDVSMRTGPQSQLKSSISDLEFVVAEN